MRLLEREEEVVDEKKTHRAAMHPPFPASDNESVGQSSGTVSKQLRGLTGLLRGCLLHVDWLGLGCVGKASQSQHETTVSPKVQTLLRVL